MDPRLIFLTYPSENQVRVGGTPDGGVGDGVV